MAILGTYSYFAPDVAELLEEAFERAGLAASTIGSDHVDSAIRSIRFMLNSEWHTIGIRQWMIERTSQVVTADDVDFDLPTGCIDVVGAVLRRDSRDTPMTRISREDYLEIPNKTDTGRPDRYYVDRRYDKATFIMWQAPENSTDTIVYDYFRQASLPGGTSNYTLQMPPHMLEAFVSGLAARVAQKWSHERFAELQILYRGGDTARVGGALRAAIDEDRERSDTRMSVSVSMPSSRRW